MSIKIFHESIDLRQNELLNVVIQNLTKPPIGPKEGQIFYGTDNEFDKKLFLFNGEWIDISSRVYNKWFDTEVEILALDPVLYSDQTMWAFDTKSAWASVFSSVDAVWFWQGVTPQYDEPTDTFYLPTTKDGQTQNLGQELFFLGINLTGGVNALATSISPEVFVSIQSELGNERYHECVKASASSLNESSIYGLNTTNFGGGERGKLTRWGDVNNVDTSAWGLGETLYADVVPGQMTNIRPFSNAYAVARVSKVHATEGILSVIASTNRLDKETLAGIVEKTYFLADETILVSGTYYDINGTLGIIGEAIGTVVINGAGIFGGLPQDHISPVYPEGTILNAGVRDGALDHDITSAASGVDRFHVEIYEADIDGVALDSGLVSQSIGDLGVKPIVVLSSSNIDRTMPLVSTEFRGVIEADYLIPNNNRIRIHIVFENVSGGNITYRAFFGNVHNSYLNTLVQLTTDDIANASTGDGSILTETLDFYKLDIEKRMWWRNRWLQTTYLRNQTVRASDASWIANKNTFENPNPEKFGDASFFVPDLPVWLTPVNPVRLYVGMDSMVPAGKIFKITAYRFWAEGTNASYIYKIWLVRFKSSGASVFNLINIFTGTQVALGWNTFNHIGSLLAEGTHFQIVVESLNSSSGTSVTGGWSREADSNNVDPSVGGWNKSNNGDTLRINITDLDAVSRETELLSIVSGSTIQFTDSLEPNRNVTYSVQDAPVLLLAGDAVVYGVTEISQGSFGVPAVGSITVMNASIPTPSTTKYVELAGALSIYPDIMGLKSTTGDYDDAIFTQDAYGIDIQVQEYTVSVDWDLVAMNSSAGSDGGTVAGLQNVVEDLTPQAGGDFDFNHNPTLPAYNIFNTGNISTRNEVGDDYSFTAHHFVVPTGLSTEFLKADGSRDGSTYLTAGDLPPDDNDYLTTHAFDIATGIFTSTMNNLSTVTTSLDGRYSLEHTHPYDNYVSWNLRTNGIQRIAIIKDGIVDLVAGADIAITYGAGGVVNIASTYTQTLLHDDLTDVTADQHHAKVHSHDGLDGSGLVDYSDLINIPTEFPPSSHQHPWSDITLTPTLLAGYGIVDTKSGYNTSLSDGDFLFVGDANNYIHPPYTPINIDTNLAGVIDSIVVDDIGSVTSITLRNMALVDLGFVDGDYVHIAGTENITGIKTFTTLPLSAVVPIVDAHLVNKLYVDNAIASIPSDDSHKKLAFVNETEVIFVHSLNEEYPILQVYDALGELFIAYITESIDINTSKFTFSEITSGTVVASAGGGGVGTGGGGSTIITQDEGILVDAAATTLNFIGDNVSVVDAGAGVTDINITGGSGGNNEVTDYRSEYEIDTKIYSGYNLNAVITIIREKNSIIEEAVGLTDLETDWTNRLTLTYI